MRNRLQFILAMILMLNVATVPQMATSSSQASTATRTVPFTLKAVFIGIQPQWVDRDYFTWDYQTPSERIDNIWNRNNWQQTGVTYKISYELTFAKARLKAELIDFLNSIGEKRRGENRWFSYREYSDSERMWVEKFYTTDYIAYDAEKVEDWLYQHRDDYGGFPENGWTFIVTYLPELPSFTLAQYEEYQANLKVPRELLPHYYGIEAVDSDLGYRVPRTDFMTGYGGHYRLWFVDLSAGPSWWLKSPLTGGASNVDDLPLNVIIEDQKINLDTAFGRRWLTQLLSDYTSETVYSLVLPQFLYDPIYSSKYRLVVKVLDDRSDEQKRAIPIQNTINRDKIRSAFEDLVPYSDVQVDLQFDNTSKYPELQRILKENRRLLDSYIIRDRVRSIYEYVDERPVYNYLQKNLHSFVPQILRNETELTIPIFVFAFSGDAHFAPSLKWYVNPNVPGGAYGDLVLLSFSHLDFHWRDEVGQEGKGVGLTRFVIHEAGHMVGLPHPDALAIDGFSGWIGHFSFSTMSVYGWNYVFGQHDKDAILRVHADKLILQTMSLEEQARGLLAGKVASPALEAKLNQVRDLIRDTEDLYAKMEYPESVKAALRARSLARSTLEEVDKLPQSAMPLEENLARTRSELKATQSQLPLYLAGGLGVGLAVAILIFLVMRRRGGLARESTKTQLIRRCNTCKKEISGESVFCEHCGARQT